MHLATISETIDPTEVADAIGADGLGYVDWLVAGGIVLGGFIVAAVARRLVSRMFRRGSAKTAHTENLVGRILQLVIVLVAFVYALGAVGVRITPLLGALGIGGLALALAIQPALLNLFSGLILHAQRPLRVGEEIVTGDVRGQVVDVTSRAVVVRAYSGETVYIPNSVVVDREIVNLDRHGRRRTTVVVGVAYGTDLAQAREVLRQAAEKPPGVLAKPGPQVFALEFAESSIDFEVDVWHAPGENTKRHVRDELIECIHQALGDAAITIPFPQRTLWFERDLDHDGEPKRDH
ncbi:MAG: mechanosensitive ion channel family protein [Acidimicrobiales bacterium]